ncbi:hypothetical protein Bca52824_013510 [Brassica carinata]|uniref:Cytochrome c oxidase assembly protein COX11, mitochondrial n=1 Tax=Brassica carinata TaxID=52824 RepID=A0A8X7VZQ5_BRACI|nr:hypothetical protein Bca52824_013510 [Brassica carinata]
MENPNRRKCSHYLTAVVFGMVGLTYAAVPLYRTFCQATGYGGTVQRKEVRVKPGESDYFYTAENKSSAPTGVSTYNVTPMKVFFYIDPEFETDSRMDGINNLILSYTFFKVSEETTTTDSVDNKSSVPVQETN